MQADEDGLVLGVPAHAVEGEAGDVAVGRLVLRRQRPKVDAALAVLAEEAHKVLGPRLVVLRQQVPGAVELVVGLHPLGRAPGTGHQPDGLGAEALGPVDVGDLEDQILFGQREVGQRRVAHRVAVRVRPRRKVRAGHRHPPEAVLDAFGAVVRPESLDTCLATSRRNYLQCQLFLYTTIVRCSAVVSPQRAID